MIQMFKRLLDFSGTERKKLILSFIFHMCNSVFEMLPIMAVLTVLNGILLSLSSGYMPVKTVWAALEIMLLSISGRILFTNLSAVKRTLGSFSMCSKWLRYRYRRQREQAFRRRKAAHRHCKSHIKGQPHSCFR